MTNWKEEIDKIKAQEEAKHHPSQEQKQQFSELETHIYKEKINPGFEALNKFQIPALLSEIRDSLIGGEMQPLQSNSDEYIQEVCDRYGTGGIQRLIETGRLGEALPFLIDGEKRYVQNELAGYELKSPKREQYAPYFHGPQFKGGFADTKDHIYEAPMLLQVISDGEYISFLYSPFGYIDVKSAIGGIGGGVLDSIHLKANNEIEIQDFIHKNFLKYCSLIMEDIENVKKYKIEHKVELEMKAGRIFEPPQERGSFLEDHIYRRRRQN